MTSQSRKRYFSGLHCTENNLLLLVQMIILLGVNILQATDAIKNDALYAITFVLDAIQIVIFHAHLIGKLMLLYIFQV